MHLFNRLKEQREDAGLTQKAVAEIAGVTKRTVIAWEKGDSSPTAVQLIALSEVGIDIVYIMTGIKSHALAEPKASYGVSLTPRESALLDNYRHIADEGDKRVVERTAQLAVEAIRDETEQKRKDDEERRNINDRRSA